MAGCRVVGVSERRQKKGGAPGMPTWHVGDTPPDCWRGLVDALAYRDDVPFVDRGVDGCDLVIRGLDQLVILQ